MRSRWPVAVGVVLVVAGAGRAQPPLPPPAPPPAATAQPGDPSLPPLLPVPPAAPLAEVPRSAPGPSGTEYDPGYLYLPEREPERPRNRGEVCGPDGRWWFGPSLELAWAPRTTLPATVRLRLADGLGGSRPGPVLPVTGRATDRFNAALGLVLGHWFGDGNINGAEASFFVRSAETTFAGYAPGMLVLFPQGTDRAPQIIPFPAPMAELFAGTFPVTLSTFYTTVDVNYRRRLYCDDRARLDALIGYRFADLQDQLYIGEYHDGSGDYKRNRASVSNPFHGAQIGLAGEYRSEDGWYAAGSAKVAFGAVAPDVTASGLFLGAEGRLWDAFQRLNALRVPTESEFAVLPTVNLTVGRQINPRTRVYGGYSFQYLSRVGRLGDALNPAANALALTDFWVQSVNLGVEVRY
ncbi:MAG TPA: BBP7 family outer membrane beta-barrel protein [Gemmata sp.]